MKGEEGKRFTHHCPTRQTHSVTTIVRKTDAATKVLEIGKNLGQKRKEGLVKPEIFHHIISGKCKCRKNFYGSDCSVTLDENHTTVPRVSSLANYGMCDVRKQPCKDVVVLGENFVDHPSLICIYETYKVGIVKRTADYSILHYCNMQREI